MMELSVIFSVNQWLKHSSFPLSKSRLDIHPTQLILQSFMKYLQRALSNLTKNWEEGSAIPVIQRYIFTAERTELLWKIPSEICELDLLSEHPVSTLMTPFPCGCLFLSLPCVHFFSLLFSVATVKPWSVPCCSFATHYYHQSPQPWVHYRDIRVTTKSSSHLRFPFCLALELTARVQWWALKHCGRHSATPEVHLCSSPVVKTRGLLLRYFQQCMISKDLPEELSLSWWWDWQSRHERKSSLGLSLDQFKIWTLISHQIIY